MSQKILLSDNEYARIELEDNIIIATWKATFVDLEIAQKVVNARRLAFMKNKYPCLIKIYSIKDSTKEARDFLASEKGCEGFTAGAIVVSSVLENIIASLYLYLNKPVVPTKIFKDELKAKEWLSKFVEKK
jgi:hypothetical protein